jgi:oligoendopeptidase F
MKAVMAPDGSHAGLGDLPRWNLADLYPAMDSPELRADLESAAAEAAAFAKRYEGRLATSTGAAFAEAIAAFERLQEKMGRLGAYAQLQFAADMSDPAIARFQQNVQEKLTDIGVGLLFFSLEINRIADDELERKLADPALARWRPWLSRPSAFRRAGEAAAREAPDRPIGLDAPVR